jgi:hypothetical protein
MIRSNTHPTEQSSLAGGQRDFIDYLLPPAPGYSYEMFLMGEGERVWFWRNRMENERWFWEIFAWDRLLFRKWRTAAILLNG